MPSPYPKKPGSIDRAKARQAALNLLNRRAISSGLLIAKLIRLGAENEDARAVAADLADTGALDDRAYAEMVIRAATRGKPAGASYLRQRLRRERLAAEIIDTAISEHLERHDVEAEAIAWARRQAARVTDVPLEKSRRRLYSQLARRGFDPETCKRAVDSALGEQPM